MNRYYRQELAAVLLLGVPFNLVQWVKSDLGPLLTTPKARQKGDPKAKVLIVEYSDFQCSACASIEPTIKQLMETYEGKIRFAFKHYPLIKAHKNAFKAAQAAECASEQKKFWPYHDRLFASQESWRDVADPSDLFTGFASELQLDTARFNQCLNGSSTRFLVEADMAEGKSRQVNSTPTFFINNKRFVGRVFASEGVRAIEEELRR